jgi:uncharacterized heparinase superfamily protein
LKFLIDDCGGGRTLAGATLHERLRLAGLLSDHALSFLRRGAVWPLRLLRQIRFRPPERLLIAPQDIRTSDPTIAADIYAGYFAFGGKIINAHGRSPFELEPRSPAWARALAGFGWLRHLRAADTALARANARALVDDFLTIGGTPKAEPAWEPQVAARRMLAWLSQSPIILDGADRAFYRRFMKGIGKLQAFLERRIIEGLDGEARLLSAIALAELGLCAEGTGKLQPRSTKLLAEELERQILPDGGHISRNPQILVDLLLDLLPLRQAYAARGFQAPAQLLNAIDRMMPMLRLFRHGDGTLALFNGMGVTAPETLATVLAYDDARAMALMNAPYTGYQRIEGQDTVFVMDTGTPPPPIFSRRAHASCLAFEFSVGGQRLIINCGAPDASRLGALAAARTTAAHSTLVLDDTSSCHFAFHIGLWSFLADQILSGPDRVKVERRSENGKTALIASHNGYESRFGWIHQRRVVLRKDGSALEGLDVLKRGMRKKPPESTPYAIRFHIHPHVRTRLFNKERSVLCILPNRRRWIFEAVGAPLSIEESIFFAAPDGPRKCRQIVIGGLSNAPVEIAWSLRHIERRHA